MSAIVFILGVANHPPMLAGSHLSTLVSYDCFTLLARKTIQSSICPEAEAKSLVWESNIAGDKGKGVIELSVGK